MFDTNKSTTPRPMSRWRLAYRIFRWTTILTAVITILLMMHKTPAPHVAADSGAGERLEAKLQQMANASASGVPQVLRLDEAEVNSYVVSHLSLKPSDKATEPESAGGVAAPSQTPLVGGEPSVDEVQSSVRDVKINLIEDRVRAYVLFDFHGKDLSLQLEGRLHAEDGYLHFEPTSGQIGSLPIPQASLETAVHKMMDSAENREKLRLPPDLRDMHIENGQIVVSYK